MRDLGNTCSAEGLQWIVCEAALSDVAAQLAMGVVRRDSQEAHRAGLHTSHACSKCILGAHSSGDDELIVHFGLLEEAHGQVAAMEADTLVRIFAVVIIPVEQRARRS